MEAALVNSLHPVIPRSRVGRWAIASAALVSVAVAIASAWAIRRNAVPTPAISSIAVLPFKDASATPKDPYLSDGLTDALINRLSAAQGLRVISSTSSMYYRDHPTLLSDVGRTLNVDAVVEGSIETSAQNVRLTARLIDPRSDRILWRKTLDESGANLAEALDALAGAIATEIQHELPEAARRRIDTSAYDAFLRGEYELAKRTPDALRNARRLFEQSIERDPEYARAHAALAEGYTLLAAFNVLPQDEGFPRARQAALESLRLDDRESMGHAVLGYVLFEFYADHDSGLRELQQALSLDPNNATARQWFALSLAAQERYGEAVYQIGQARETDPLSKMIASDAANVYRRAGQLDKAREELRRLLNLYPDFVEAHRELAFVDERLGDYRRAREEYKVGARQGRPEDFFLLGGLGYVNARLGDRSSAEEIFANLKRRLPKQPEAYASYILVGVALNRVRDVEAVLPVCRALGARCRPGLDRPEVQHVLDALGGT